VVTKGRCLPLMAFPKESYHLNDRRVIWRNIWCQWKGQL
jgi:hypothetical protein